MMYKYSAIRLAAATCLMWMVYMLSRPSPRVAFHRDGGADAANNGQQVAQKYAVRDSDIEASLRKVEMVQFKHKPVPDDEIDYHKIWLKAESYINDKHLIAVDTDDIEEIHGAMRTAPIVSVDVVDVGVEFEHGTSHKWIVHLKGGQKVMAKILWETKGVMKYKGNCNFGFEMPSSEIAAYHFHRHLGFTNTPYVVGRQLDLVAEVLPVSSPAVADNLLLTSGNESCLKAKCHFCKTEVIKCFKDHKIMVSLAYWIPKRITSFTKPPDYMPWSTPQMKRWSKFKFNDDTFCKEIRNKEIYKQDENLYDDLFDFAILDSLMYHFDSKQYRLDNGLRVRFDHGRAFCNSEIDELNIFLAPVTQCCRVRNSTYISLYKYEGREDEFIKEFDALLSTDLFYPVLDMQEWYPVLARRRILILDEIEKCLEANGHAKVLF